MYDGPHSRTHAWERLWGATRVPMRTLLLGILLLGVRAEAVAEATLDDGYHAMYNLQFEAAHRIFGQWQETQPDDPFAHVSDALRTCSASLTDCTFWRWSSFSTIVYGTRSETKNRP